MVNGFKRGSHFWVNYELAIFTIKMRDFIKKEGKNEWRNSLQINYALANIKFIPIVCCKAPIFKCNTCIKRGGQNDYST